MITKLEKIEKEKNTKERLMLIGAISSDEYYSFIDEYHKTKEKILMRKGCYNCGSKNLIEYSTIDEIVECYDCHERR